MSIDASFISVELSLTESHKNKSIVIISRTHNVQK